MQQKQRISQAAQTAAASCPFNQKSHKFVSKTPQGSPCQGSADSTNLFGVFLCTFPARDLFPLPRTRAPALLVSLHRAETWPPLLVLFAFGFGLLQVDQEKTQSQEEQQQQEKRQQLEHGMQMQDGHPRSIGPTTTKAPPGAQQARAARTSLLLSLLFKLRRGQLLPDGWILSIANLRVSS